MSEAFRSAEYVADQCVEVVIHRLAGATFEAIRLLHGIKRDNARTLARRAIRLGYAPAASIAGTAYGRPKKKRISDADYPAHWAARIKSKCVIDANGCWVWQGFVPKSGNGYGQDMWRGRNIRVHRQMYLAVHGVTLTPKQYVCHSCDVRLCCNPDHLWVGSASDNQLDSARKGRHQETKKTHCPRGHALSGENVYMTPSGTRACNACARARHRVRVLGWPEELAYSLPALANGQFPVSGHKGNKRRAA